MKQLIFNMPEDRLFDGEPAKLFVSAVVVELSNGEYAFYQLNQCAYDEKQARELALKHAKNKYPNILDILVTSIEVKP